MDFFDLLLAKKLADGGGSSTTVEELSVTENGTYNAETGTAYNPVKVNVPEIEVTSLTVTENGTYNAQTGNAYNPVNVNVLGFDYVIDQQTVEITSGNLPTINVDDSDLQDWDPVVIKVIIIQNTSSFMGYTIGYWSSSPSSIICDPLHAGGLTYNIIIEKVEDGIYSFDVQVNGSSYPATYTITAAKIPF